MEPYDYEEDQLSPIARLARTAKKINTNLDRIATAFESIANSLEVLVASKNRPNLTPAEEAIVAGEQVHEEPDKKEPAPIKEEPVSDKHTWGNIPLSKIATNHLLKLFEIAPTPEDEHEFYLELMQRKQEGKLTKKEDRQFQKLILNSNATEESAMLENDPLPHW